MTVPPGAKGLKRRLLVGGALWAALALEGWLGMSPYTAWVLALPLLLWCAAPFHRAALRGLRSGGAGADLLISLSAAAAFLFSTPAVFAADLLPPEARRHRLASMGALITLSLLGRWLESRMRKNTGMALDKLQRRIPATARVVREGREVNAPLEEVAAGERILVRPGEQVPLDGEVAEGSSLVEESIWTGSDVPVEKSPGSRVLGGTINKSAPLALSVTRDRATMALTRIIETAREGLSSKRPGLRLADAWSHLLVPVALAAAGAAALGWFWKGPRPPQALAFTALGLTLAGACPWGLTLAGPLSLLAGMRRAAELGVTIRNPDILEGLPHPDVVIIDKKGILTEGRPDISEVICFKGWSEEKLLRMAMAAERRSSHLFAEALRRRGHAPAPEKPLPALESFEAYPGLGVSALLEGKRVLVGSLGWLRGQGIEPDAQASLGLQGKTDSLVGVSVDGRLAGAIAFSDPVRPAAADEVRELESLGMQVVLASGDRNATAYRVAELTGIAKVFAEVEEDEKVRIISQLQEQGKKVAIVGQDLRDAPSLSRADLGAVVARPQLAGAGMDLALESADLVLARQDLKAFAAAVRFGDSVRRLHRENLSWCFGWSLLCLPAGAGALYPAFHAGWAPAWSVGAALLGLVSMVVNSIRFGGARREQTR